MTRRDREPRPDGAEFLSDASDETPAAEHAEVQRDASGAVLVPETTPALPHVPLRAPRGDVVAPRDDGAAPAVAPPLLGPGADPAVPAIPVLPARELNRFTAFIEPVFARFESAWMWTAIASLGGLVTGQGIAVMVTGHVWGALVALLGVVMVVTSAYALNRRSARTRELQDALTTLHAQQGTAVAALRQEHKADVAQNQAKLDAATSAGTVTTEALSQTQDLLDDLIKRALTRLYLHHDYTGDERITLLRYSGSDIIVIGRHCANDSHDKHDHGELRERRFDRRFGVIGRALDRDYCGVDFEVAAGVTYEQWQQRVGRISEERASALGMRSVVYRAVAVYDYGRQKKIGVVVLESLRPQTRVLNDLYAALRPGSAATPGPELTTLTDILELVAQMPAIPGAHDENETSEGAL